MYLSQFLRLAEIYGKYLEFVFHVYITCISFAWQLHYTNPHQSIGTEVSKESSSAKL